MSTQKIITQTQLPTGSYLLIEKNGKKTKTNKCSGEGKGEFYNIIEIHQGNKKYKRHNLVYKGQYKDCKYNGIGELFKDSELIYKGSFKDNKYDGEGELFEDNKLIYKGTFKESKYDGEGELFKDDKLIYKGTFKESKYDGEGKLFNKNDTLLYEGGFNEGKYDGEGELFKDSELIYKGTFKDDKYYTGNGKLYRDGIAIYTGTFEDGKYYTGKGKLYIGRDLIYDGDFIDGKYHGNGKLYGYDKVYSTYGGLLYEGQFKDGKYNGEGVLNNIYKIGNIHAKVDTMTNFKLYEGTFKDGIYDGYGKLYEDIKDITDKKDILKYEGTFKNGEYNTGKGKKENRINLYVGDFKDGKYDGEGKLYFICSSPYATLDKKILIYDGKFREGQYDGKGILYKDNTIHYRYGASDYVRKNNKKYFKETKLYEGSFKNGEYDGEGKLFEEGEYDGTDEDEFNKNIKLKYEGEFQNGKFIKGKIYSNDGTINKELTENNTSINITENKANVKKSNKTNETTEYEDPFPNGGGNKKNTYKRKSRSRKVKNQKGGKKYKTMWCSQAIVNLPRMDCLKKHCTGTKKYKDDVKKLVKLNKQHDKFVSKKCNIKIDALGELSPDTPEQWKCNSIQRKSKLFKNILKLEKEISTSKCEEKNCANVNYMHDCIDLGEEQCRIKYKDVIENIKKTKKKTILPLEACLSFTKT